LHKHGTINQFIGPWHKQIFEKGDLLCT